MAEWREILIVMGLTQAVFWSGWWSAIQGVKASFDRRARERDGRQF